MLWEQHEKDISLPVLRLLFRRVWETSVDVVAFVVITRIYVHPEPHHLKPNQLPKPTLEAQPTPQTQPNP
ncbi:hypothetical protein RJT34_23152 [Clitoria ternatea]|uniref:Uncharacterized protein n=1 Tax=Clitoria ternatea TaxID=43366 RepID=A0AAN9FKG0_CLITE